MPKKDDAHVRGDIGGGTESVPGVQDKRGDPVENYRPAYALHFQRRAVDNVPDALFRFYRQPEDGRRVR
jgi:hypothetical protein